MSNFVLNHGCLIGETNSILNEKIKELINKINLVKENNATLAVVEDFWNIGIQQGKLFDFIINNLNKDQQLLAINGLMNSGPFFTMENDFENADKLVLNPIIEEDTFGYNFLYSNILNDNLDIISFENPKFISKSNYSFEIDTLNGNINNLIGISAVNQFFTQSLVFKNIGDVFTKIEMQMNNIVILDHAKRTAERHNFQGCLTKVYKAIKGLSEIEVEPLSREEGREERFYNRVALRISPESKSTLDIPRYRAEREFVIPNLGKQLFEWHVKISNHTRIHYYLDETTKTVYIGHCAHHLGTTSFNS